MRPNTTVHISGSPDSTANSLQTTTPLLSLLSKLLVKLSLTTMKPGNPLLSCHISLLLRRRTRTQSLTSSPILLHCRLTITTSLITTMARRRRRT
ncbi:hypothetical protein AAF712_016867, partial [Marasmius tenuissimus]